MAVAQWGKLPQKLMSNPVSVNQNIQKLTVTFHESLIEHKVNFNNVHFLASFKWSLFWHKRGFLINIHLVNL